MGGDRPLTQLVYSPPPSVAGFLRSEAFISMIVGPIGSTKTTAGIMKIAYHAKRMAKARDGVRRSRAIWVRNTREQLRDTSIPDFLKWYPDGLAGTFTKTENKFVLRFDDVECEVLFRGLDDVNDVRRLLSLQASFGVLDEFREINPAIFEALQGRLGRYPDGMMVPHRPEWGVDDKGNPVQGCVTEDGKANRLLWGMSNPPDFDTYWEKFLTGPPANASVFFQPSGVSQEADWIHYLPNGYYENLMEGKTEDWIDVYVHAKFGKSLSGRPVYRSFNPDFHVAKEPLRILRASTTPIIVGMDFGLQPSAVISQLDPRGRLLTYDALTSEGMGVTRFLQSKLKPLLVEKYGGMRMIVVGDPAGAQRVQTDERSVFDILRQEGFEVTPARTNSIVARIAAVDAFLTRQVDGGPGRLIDPSCRILINALRGNYRYKLRKNGETEDKPEKNEASHIADADQYGCLYADAGSDRAALWSTGQRRQVRTVSAGGWT